jgi:hypothetical protein
VSDSVSVRRFPARQIDYSPLLRRLAPGETVRFRARVRREGTAYPDLPRPGFTDVISALGALVISVPVVVLELAMLVLMLAIPESWALGAVVGVSSIALAGACLYLIWRENPLLTDWSDPWKRRLRIAEFASVNDFDLVPESAAVFAPIDPQAVDGSGVVTDRLISRSAPAMEIGNLRYLTHSWQEYATIHTGYFALERPTGVTGDALAALQAALDRAGLGIQVQQSAEWIVLHSAVGFNLVAPQTYRVLFWIATQLDQRRGDPQPISMDEYLTETRRIAQRSEDNFARRLTLVSAAVATVWLVLLLVTQLVR